jgi:integrase
MNENEDRAIVRADNAPVSASLERFLLDRKIMGVSPKTIQWYATYLVRWETFREGASNLQGALRAYLDEYRCSASQQAAFRAVRAFERWAARESHETSWIQDTRIHFDPTPRYPVLTESEFHQVMSQLGPSLRDQRDKCLYETLWYTGQRLDAIRLLKRSDVDLVGKRLLVHTKGGVTSPVVLPEPAREGLERWLKMLDFNCYVFPSFRTGRPISPFAISHRLPLLAKQAGVVKRCWVHGLRHSAITHWVNSGVPVELAQRQALHSNLSTTMAYVQIAGKTVEDALDRVYAKPAGGEHAGVALAGVK